MTAGRPSRGATPRPALPAPGRESREPYVAVVVPAYNASRHLERCAASVLGQSYSNWTLHISVNLSSDSTAGIARRLAAASERIFVSESPEFLNVYGSWNRAMSLAPANAEYVKHVNADTLLTTNCLRIMTGVAEADPSIAVVSSRQLNSGRLRGVDIEPTVEAMPGADAVRALFLRGMDYIDQAGALLFRNDPAFRTGHFYRSAPWPPGLGGSPAGSAAKSATSDPFRDKEPVYRLLAGRRLGFVHDVMTIHEDALRGDGEDAHSNRLRSYTPSLFSLLLRVGDEFMERKEVDRRAYQLACRYTAGLMRHIARGRAQDPVFRRFHAAALAQLSDDLRAGGRARTARLLVPVRLIYEA